MTATGKAAQIPDALLARVQTLSVGSPALPISYPDVPFHPATDAPDERYLEVAYLPNNRPKWQGVNGGSVNQGILQITVIWPRGQGVIGPNEDAEEVKAHFSTSLVLRSGATNVKITEDPLAVAPIFEADKTRVPVLIAWAA